MTDVFYVAVKGSLHSSDSSVFGLNSEEVAALSKRYNNAKKEVINGVLIKANPLEVINSLSELGYRVACSSGEAEIIWTLRREVLDQRTSTSIPRSSFKRPSIAVEEDDRYTRRPSLAVDEDDRYTRRSSTPAEHKSQVLKTPFVPRTDKRPKRVERIGTKPEDFAEWQANRSGSRILVINPEDVENVPDEQKVIIKSNLSSEDNPMLPWNQNDPDARPRRPNHYTTTQVYSTSDSIPCSSNMSCSRPPPIPSVHQTMEEMDFERGLWYPALTGDLPRVRTLLDKGHHPDEEDKNGYTALHYASRSGFTTICTRLLEAGANINKVTRAGGATPLHRAALAGNDDTVTVLIKYGANLLAKDADGRIPLHRAVEAQRPTTVVLLLEASPESIHAKDRAGKTPRHYVNPNDKVMGQLFDIIEDSSPKKRPTAGTSLPSKSRQSVSPAGRKNSESIAKKSTDSSGNKSANGLDKPTKKSPDRKTSELPKK